MAKKTNPLEELRQSNPYRVPEGYFDGLSEQIMANLPAKVVEEEQVLTLWQRVKPWVYMAAMFAGIALMVKVFVGPTVDSPGNDGLNLTSSAEIEAFYNYYEEQYAISEYREAYLLGEFEEF